MIIMNSFTKAQKKTRFYDSVCIIIKDIKSTFKLFIQETVVYCYSERVHIYIYI